MQLLTQSLPWNNALTNTPSAPEDPLLASTPAVTLADRLGRKRLSEPWQQLLTQYDTAPARSAPHSVVNSPGDGAAPTSQASKDRDRTLGAGIDD